MIKSLAVLGRHNVSNNQIFKDKWVVCGLCVSATSPFFLLKAVPCEDVLHVSVNAHFNVHGYERMVKEWSSESRSFIHLMM